MKLKNKVGHTVTLDYLERTSQPPQRAKSNQNRHIV